jgi:hypothetical protein
VYGIGAILSLPPTIVLLKWYLKRKAGVAGSKITSTRRTRKAQDEETLVFPVVVIVAGLLAALVQQMPPAVQAVLIRPRERVTLARSASMR